MSAFPSSLRLNIGETLRITKESDGVYSVDNAYAGTVEEFFPGRPEPIVVVDREEALSINATWPKRLDLSGLPKVVVDLGSEDMSLEPDESTNH
jgi:hypothetical protein